MLITRIWVSEALVCVFLDTCRGCFFNISFLYKSVITYLLRCICLQLFIHLLGLKFSCSGEMMVSTGVLFTIRGSLVSYESASPYGRLSVLQKNTFGLLIVLQLQHAWYGWLGLLFYTVLLVQFRCHLKCFCSWESTKMPLGKNINIIYIFLNVVYSKRKESY